MTAVNRVNRVESSALGISQIDSARGNLEIAEPHFASEAVRQRLPREFCPTARAVSSIDDAPIRHFDLLTLNAVVRDVTIFTFTSESNI